MSSAPSTPPRVREWRTPFPRERVWSWHPFSFGGLLWRSACGTGLGGCVCDRCKTTAVAEFAKGGDGVGVVGVGRWRTVDTEVGSGFREFVDFGGSIAMAKRKHPVDLATPTWFSPRTTTTPNTACVPPRLRNTANPRLYYELLRELLWRAIRLRVRSGEEDRDCVGRRHRLGQAQIVHARVAGRGCSPRSKDHRRDCGEEGVPNRRVCR